MFGLPIQKWVCYNSVHVGKTDDILESVGKELKDNPPAIVQSTKKKFGAARGLAQQRAILLSKARRQGANIPGPRSMSSR